MELILTVIFVILAIIFVGFFSGAETALISLNRPKLKYLVESKIKEAVIINDLLANTDRLLASLLIGTNISVIIASALFTNMVIKNFGGSGELYATLILIPVILIFGEIIPKAVFRQMADQIVLPLAWPLLFFYRLFRPLISVFSMFANSAIWILGLGKKKVKSPFVTREELKHLIQESEKQGVIKPSQRSIIYKIFDFGATKVKKIMVHTDKIVWCDINMPIDDFKSLVLKTGFSKIPVYDKVHNNFMGVINILDILYNQVPITASLSDFVKPVLFISEDAVIDKVLLTMQTTRQSLAMLVDRNNRHIGMVTIKDLIEEIVGDLE